MFLLKIITRVGCFGITMLKVPTEKVPYLAINLILAKQMGWIVETTTNVFAVGSNLLMELPYGTTSVKPGTLSIQPKFPVCHSGKFPVQMERPFPSQEQSLVLSPTLDISLVNP